MKISYPNNNKLQKHVNNKHVGRGFALAIGLICVWSLLFGFPLGGNNRSMVVARGGRGELITATAAAAADQRAQMAELRAERVQLEEEDGLVSNLKTSNQKFEDELDDRVRERREKEAIKKTFLRKSTPVTEQNIEEKTGAATGKDNNLQEAKVEEEKPIEPVKSVPVDAQSATPAKKKIDEKMDAATDKDTNLPETKVEEEEKPIETVKSAPEEAQSTTPIAPRDSLQATTLPIDVDDETAIRKWGCARNETPFIFVHIGKAGGGGVRSRMAAAALEYNRSGWHRTHEDSNYYYPIYDQNGTLHKGKFLSSKHTNYIHPDLKHYHGEFIYEGHGPCGAATPIGQSVACPIASSYCDDQDEDSVSDGDRCDLIYMGHNLLGSEVHWLPTNYLVQWWKTTRWGQQADDFLGQVIADRHTLIDQEWPVHPKVREIVGHDKIPTIQCLDRPFTYRPFKSQYQKCFKPKEQLIDKATRHVVGVDPIQNARMMASMPIMRATVLREPFSWLGSKFFWHGQHFLKNGTVVAPDKGPARNKIRTEKDQKKNDVTPPFIKCDDIKFTAEWAGFRAMSYMFYFCGEHCLGGWADGSMDLADIERQSAYNLRNSFAVVGLLHNTDDFYDMVRKRVYYMDTSLNPEVEGKKHGSGDHLEAQRCKQVFKTQEFQDTLLKMSPVLAALNRLYKIAAEVNEFQTKELADCSAG